MIIILFVGIIMYNVLCIQVSSKLAVATHELEELRIEVVER